MPDENAVAGVVPWTVLETHDLGHGLVAEIVIPAPPGGLEAAAQQMKDAALEEAFAPIQCRITLKPTLELAS